MIISDPVASILNFLNGWYLQIDHLHASENILIEQLIAVTSRLDALVTHKNVLQPMGIRRSTAIKQPSQTKHTV